MKDILAGGKKHDLLPTSSLCPPDDGARSSVSALRPREGGELATYSATLHPNAPSLVPFW